jgi:uncharacterized cupredoxin-like copper-binding protein
MQHGLSTAFALLWVVAASAPAWADATVNVVLQDATDGGDIQGMKMTATPDSVKAGRVTFHAFNQSKGLVHEVMVVRPPKRGAELPYNDKTGQVIEKQITHLGEVSDLAPGKSGSLTLRLTPGSYLLVCNQPNHYKSGMSTTLTVTQ